MEAGALNRRITIQKRTIATDSDGYHSETWTTHETRMAEKITTGGREFYAAQKLNAETTAVFRVRFTNAITRNMRIVDGARTYEIIAPPNNVDGRSKELLIMTRELV